MRYSTRPKKVIQGSCSVRQTEMLVARYSRQPTDDAGNGPNEVDPNVTAAIHTLEQTLGTKVTLQEHGGKGKIEIHFFSFEEMNRLYEGLLRTKF